MCNVGSGRPWSPATPAGFPARRRTGWNDVAYLLIRSQVLIQGFATDSEFTSKLGLLLASLDTLAQFGNTLRRQGFLPATVSPALLGERNTLALTLADQGALELGERAHHREHQVRHRRVFASKTEVFLDEFDMHAALCQRLHDPAQIIEIARQAIHAMHHHGVAGAGEAYQRFQLRTLDILAGCLVAKSAINLDAFQLPFRVLVEGADPALLQIVGGDKLIIPFC